MIRFSTRPPSVSVVMPVYNGGQYLAEAMNSILGQSFRDFEFIIIDDGSTDSSVEMIRSFKDKKIVFHQNQRNIGNYASRNIGIRIARGRYICVMDADDISFPHRLEKQFAYMEAHSDVGICGSFIQLLPSRITPTFITDDELLKVAFLCNNHCSHPSLIMRKSYLDKFELMYNEAYYYAADFDICASGFQHFKVHNLSAILLQYRRHKGQISTAKFAEQQKFADQIRIKQLTENLGFGITEIPVSLHLQLMRREPIDPIKQIAVHRWINAICDKNRLCHYYEENRLNQFLYRLMHYCTISNEKS